MIKSEIRMLKSERNPNSEIRAANAAAVATMIGILDLGLLSAFGFRPSDF